MTSATSNPGAAQHCAHYPQFLVVLDSGEQSFCDDGWTMMPFSFGGLSKDPKIFAPERFRLTDGARLRSGVLLSSFGT